MNENQDQQTFNIFPTSGEVVIRHGEALPLKEIDLPDIYGKIDTPINYWDLRQANHNVDDCLVVVSDETINLYLNESDPYRSRKVVGILKLDDELTKWGINQDITYGNESLARLVKANQFLFDSKEQWQHVYNSLARFTSNVNLNITNVKETSGDREKAIKITVKNDMPEGFTLKTKIFDNKRHKFYVFLGADVIGHDVKFYLDSPDLALLVSELKDKLINENIKDFLGIMAVIRQ